MEDEVISISTLKMHTLQIMGFKYDLRDLKEGMTILPPGKNVDIRLFCVTLDYVQRQCFFFILHTVPTFFLFRFLQYLPQKDHDFTK